jgi:hypothetical protein
MSGFDVRRICILVCALLALAATGFAQLTTTSIHGIVRDPSGALIPNAAVKLIDTGTRAERNTTSGSDGAFVFAGLQAATYKLTVSAAGFQNAVYDNVAVDSGRVTDVSVQMTVGAATQSVEVSAVAAQLETTSNEVGVTINNKSIQDLPYSSRDSLNFTLLQAGAVSNGGSSVFNGLPNASLAITLDGMDNNSERFKSGGTSFYAFAPARIDAIEQVTVSTAGMGADASAMGATSLRFTTKRGTEQYHGVIGEQFQNEALNANSFFNNLRGLPRSKTRQNNAYGSIGGRLVPFVPYLKNKLFFFAYFEAQPQPGATTLTTRILTPDSQAGRFTYVGTDGVQRTVNLLQAAGAAGFTSTIDPTISGIFGTINGTLNKAADTLNVTGQPYWQNMTWVQSTETNQVFPSARVDYQITPNVAWHGTWNLRYQNIHGSQPTYPGLDQYAFPNAYKITTYVGTNSVDWTISPRMLNTFTFGVQSNGEYFYQGSDAHEWAPYGNRRLSLPLIASPIPSSGNVLPFIRNNPVYQFRDDLTRTHNKHTTTFGGIFKTTNFWETSYGTGGVPVYNFGVSSSDSAGAALTAALPAINNGNGDLGNAMSLYALLTGRLTSISATTQVDENTHQYVQFQPTTQRFAFATGGMYVQDIFRVTPTLTLNYGFRWEFDGATHSTNSIDGLPVGGSFLGPSTQLFAPGSLNGNQNPSLSQVNNPYKRDFVNPSPNFGFAWNPAGGSGLMAKLLGNHKTVIRASYTLAYYNEGMNAISNVLSGNRGATQTASASAGNPGFPVGGVNLSSPTPPLTVTPASFSFPIPLSNYALVNPPSLQFANPNMVTPYTHNWTIGIQREIPGRAVVEVRYLGNSSIHLWHFDSINEVNIFENGFLPQFKQAQTNLAINQANGKGATFANNGLAGQANMPIFDTAFGANGTQPALAANSGYASSGFITNLQQGTAGSLASSLASTSSPTYFCRLVGAAFGPCAAQGYTKNTGYPINFFTPNPYASNLSYQDSNGNNHYNALQVDFRKATSHGLSLNANFNWSHALGDLLNASDQTATYQWITQRNARLSYGPSATDRRFVFNAFWTYDLPFGKGRKFFNANAILDRIVGGWTLGGIETIASGGPSMLTSGRNTFNNQSSGVVFGNGLTLDGLRDALSTIPDKNRVINGALITNVANLVQPSGIVDPKYYAPNSTPGDLGQLVYLYGKTTYTFNMSVNKAIRIHERLRMGFRLEALNFLNHPFFTSLGSSTVTGNTFGQVTSTSGTRSALLRGYVSW